MSYLMWCTSEEHSCLCGCVSTAGGVFLMMIAVVTDEIGRRLRTGNSVVV